MGSEKIRLGMVGTGGFGRTRRTRIRSTGLFKLVSCYDRDPRAMAQACAEDGAAPADSYEAILARPDVEAIVISTGARFHADQIRLALDAGKHVFVEKPFCATPEELNNLREACRATKLVVGVGHVDHRSSALAGTIREHLTDDKVGKIAAIEMNTSHGGGLVIKPGDWRGVPEQNPGGMLFQCGVHLLHLAQSLFGPIDRVAAFFRDEVHQATATVDAACCLLHFRDGLIGTLNCYHVTAYEHVIRLFGTAGNLHIDYHRRTGFFQPRVRDQVEEQIPLQLPNTDDQDGLRSFHDAIRFGTPVQPSWEEGLRAVAVVFAAAESARTGAAVPVASV